MRTDERPDDDRDPRHADHVRLQRHEEQRGEGRRQPRNGPQADERDERPGDEDETAEQAGLDRELRIGRLAGLDLDVGACGRDSGVADAEPPRVMQYRPRAVTQAGRLRPERVEVLPVSQSA